MAVATLLRLGLGWFGVSLLWATYYPAVFIVALLAGVPAAVAVIIASILMALWAFMPAGHGFGVMTRTDVADFVIFILSSIVIVVFSEFYRETILELRERDRERDFLMRELEHRGRNTYAVVDAILRTSLTDDRETADAISARVRAASSANELVKASNTNTVQLKALLALSFAYNVQSQWSVSGPDVELSPEAAQMLGLLFHELITNAMKYGSLSTPNGSVIVEWKIDGERVNLVWAERGGPPVVPVQRRGFGSIVMTQAVRSLSGEIAYRFNPDGLVSDISFEPNP